MTSSRAIPTSLPGRPEKFAARTAFFIAGLGTAAWTPLVPYAKVRLNLETGSSGLLLLCLGIGSVVVMPLAGMLTAKYGRRLVIFVSSAMFCLTLPLLASATSLPLLVVALLVFDAAWHDRLCNKHSWHHRRTGGRAANDGKNDIPGAKHTVATDFGAQKSP